MAPSASGKKGKVLPNHMQLNTEKTKTVLVRTSDQEWLTTSLSSGVARRLIERKGGDIARATTVVKFGPDQTFPPHTHTGGEEFIVLDGHWRDKYGVFPKYTYIRNFIGSEHAPFIGSDGCKIMVKLCQMHPTGGKPAKEPEHKAWTGLTAAKVKAEGKQVAEIGGACVYHELELFSNGLETVKIMVLPKGQTSIHLPVPKNGQELFVVDGKMNSSLGEHNVDSWARLTEEKLGKGGKLKVNTSASPCDVYLWSKEGHLKSKEIDLELARKQELEWIEARKKCAECSDVHYGGKKSMKKSSMKYEMRRQFPIPFSLICHAEFAIVNPLLPACRSK
ncbi:unnamed protein product [Amoebophrya sp. A120]|nr:unnamed protein product [Amoebophrya sp. A120]|eukprot:GSA120T00012783001.1